MSSIGYATLSVIPSLRGLDRNVLAQLNGQAGKAGGTAGTRFGDEFSRRASKSVSSIGPKLAAVAKGAGYVTLAALGAGTALGVLGVKSAASLEQTRTSFAALLGSQKAANAEIAQLQKYAAKTPFSQQDIFGYAQQFFALAQSVGLSRDQLTPFLDAIGNLGAVTGASTEGIHNAVLAIAQIGSRGKVTLDNLNQLSQAFPGFNGAAAIANATGKTTAQVMKAINKGTLDAKTGINALLIGMQNFKGASGAMAKQSETLNGLFSTFGDTVKIKLTNAFQKLVPVVKQELSTLTPVIGKTLENLAPVIASFATNLAPVLAPLTQGLGQALGAVFSVLGPVLKNLAPLLQPLTNAFVGLVQAIQPLIVFASQIVAQVGPPLLGIFKELLTALSPVVHALTSALAPVLPVIALALRRMASALKPVVGALSGAFVQVIKELAPQLPQMAKAFGDLAVALAQVLTSLAPAIPLIVQMMTQFTGPTVKAMTLVAKALTVMADAVRPLITALKPLLSALGKLADLAQKAFGWLGKIGDIGHSVSSSLDFLGGVLSNVDVAVVQSGLHFDKLTGTFVTVGSAAAGAGNSMNILKAAAGGIGAIAGPLSGAFNGVSGAIGAVSGNIKTLLTNAATALAVLGASGLGGIGAAVGIAGALAAAAGSINTGVQTGGGGSFSIPPGGIGGGGGKDGGGKGSGSKPPKPGKFDKGTLSALRQSLTGDAPGIKSAIQSIEQSLRQAKKAIPAYIAGEATQLEKWAGARTAVVAKLAKATGALQNIQGKYNSLLGSVRDATLGSFDITTAGAHAQVFNDRAAAPTTAGSILAALIRQVANAKRFDSVLRKLRREGMPAALVQQLALAGPGALAQAQALAQSTPAQIAKFQSGYKALKNTSTDLGTFLAKDSFGAGVKAAQGLVDGLKSKKSHLTKEIEKLGQALIDQLKNTLKIHSPSRVMFELGGHTAEGFRLGIASGYAGVGRAGAGLGNNAAASKFGAGGSATHNHTWNITQQEDPVGTATAVIRRMQFLGV